MHLRQRGLRGRRRVRRPKKPGNNSDTENEDSCLESPEEPIALRTRRRGQLDEQTADDPPLKSELTEMASPASPARSKDHSSRSPNKDPASVVAEEVQESGESERLRLRFKRLEGKDDLAPAASDNVAHWLLENQTADRAKSEQGSPRRRKFHEENSDDDSDESQVTSHSMMLLLRRHGFESVNRRIGRRRASCFKSLATIGHFEKLEMEKTWPFQKHSRRHKGKWRKINPNVGKAGEEVPAEPFMQPGRFAGGAGSRVVYNFVMGRLLGKGGEAQVFHARDSIHNKEAAVKVTKGFGNTPEPAIYEPLILRHLKHPRIIGMYYYSTEKLKIYTVLEFMTGGDLGRYLESRKRLTEHECRFYFRQVVEGLIYLKRLRIVHRDLKVENLLLDGCQKNLKIADFGQSEAECEWGTRQNAKCGTRTYWAPERHRKNDYDPYKCEVWAAGVILYHMDVYRTVFPGIYDLPYQVSLGRWPKLNTPHYVGAAMTAFLRRMVHKDENERATIEEVSEDTWLNSGDLWLTKPPILVTSAMDNQFSKTRNYIRRTLEKHSFAFGPDM